MDFAALIEQIFQDAEEDRLERAVFKCLRLARNLNDHLNYAVFLRELYGDASQFNPMFAEATRELNDEAVQYLRKASAESYWNGRQLRFSLKGTDDEPQLLTVGAGELDTEPPRIQQLIEKTVVPPGMSPFDTAAFTDAANVRIAEYGLRLSAVQTVRHRVKARCVWYAISVEKQLNAQRQPELFLHRIQTDVNNYFRSRSEDVYAKLQKASQLVSSGDVEDRSLLLTEVRRALKAVADHFYPPAGRFICSDGKVRELGEEQYLNRLEEYVRREFSDSTSEELLKAELNVLTAFMRKLNDITSKGVHADVSGEEARQGIVGLYMLLFNLVTKLQGRGGASKP